MTDLTDTALNRKFVERWAWLPGFIKHKFTPTSVISILLAAFSCGTIAANYRGKFHTAETARAEDHQLLVEQTKVIGQLSGQLGKLDTTLNNLNDRMDHLENFRDNLMLDFREAREVYVPKGQPWQAIEGQMGIIRRIRTRLQDLIDRLMEFGDRLHESARRDPANSDQLRSDAELVYEARKELWNQHQGAVVKNCSDDSISGNSAPVQVTRFSLPKDTREILISIVMAISVLTSLVLWSKLHDAEKDIQTQIWLRSDSLSKENAELRGHVIALQDLVQAYGIGKTVKESKQEK